MKAIPLIGMILFSLLNTVYAADSDAPSNAEKVNPQRINKSDFCLFAGSPPSDATYTV